MTIAVAMIVAVLTIPFLAGRPKPNVVVEPVVIAAGGESSSVGDDLTNTFLAGLMRANAFNVIDARTDQQVDADFYLISSVNSQEEQIEFVDAESGGTYVEPRVTFLRIDISVADSSGKVLLTDMGELDETIVGTAGSAAAPIIEHLVGRVVTYVGIVGQRYHGKSLEGSVVAIMGSTNAIVDKGSKAGLAPGDELEIRRGDVVTNDKGDVIFSRMESIGKAEVSEVQDEGALITVAASLELKEGDTVVRMVPETPAAEHVETGDALYDASFYMQAASEYLAALDSDPKLWDVLLRLAVAHIKDGNHGAAYKSFTRFLDAGQPVELAATHLHSFGRCQGKFTLTRESVGYRSPREDNPKHWFDVPLAAVVESQLREPHLRESGQPVDTNLVLRAPSAEQVGKNKGDSKNWMLKFDLRGENTEVARIISHYILRAQGR